jgi:hypothetical protein
MVPVNGCRAGPLRATRPEWGFMIVDSINARSGARRCVATSADDARQALPSGPKTYPLRKATETAATSVPACGLIVTDCLSPWVCKSRRAVKPAPAAFATIPAALTRPEILPDTPRVRRWRRKAHDGRVPPRMRALKSSSDFRSRVNFDFRDSVLPTSYPVGSRS